MLLGDLIYLFIYNGKFMDEQKSVFHFFEIDKRILHHVHKKEE